VKDIIRYGWEGIAFLDKANLAIKRKKGIDVGDNFIIFKNFGKEGKIGKTKAINERKTKFGTEPVGKLLISLAVPATLFALFGRFPPNSKLKLVAAPTPVISPIARQIVVSGKATFVAAFPRNPIFCPIKI